MCILGCVCVGHICAHPCMRVHVCIKVEQQRITVDTAAALESDNAASLLPPLPSVSVIPRSLSLSLLFITWELCRGVNNNSHLYLLVDGVKRRRETGGGGGGGEDSGCTPAARGENCHNDRGGDREMKGREKTSVGGGAGEGDVAWKEGRKAGRKERRSSREKDERRQKTRGGKRESSCVCYRLLTSVCPAL